MCYDTAVAEEAPSFPQKRVMRDVAATVLRDLLDHLPRAAVAFVDGSAVVLLMDDGAC